MGFGLHSSSMMVLLCLNCISVIKNILQLANLLDDAYFELNDKALALHWCRVMRHQPVARDHS